jgi:hypothetical protein
VQQLFDTTELLESVLLELPTIDLLFAQGVCKRWKQVIERSRRLQQALFFKSTTKHPVNWCCINLERRDLNICINPRQKVYINPLLKWLLFVFEDSDLLPGQSVNELIELRLLHESWLRPEASWRKMVRQLGT